MKRKLKLIFISILIVPILSGCTKEKMELKNNSFTVEYGNAISDKAEDYLKNSEEFLKNLKVENLPKNEKDKEYPSIGEYEIVLKTDNQKEVVKVSVKDTVAPEFKDLKEKYEGYCKIHKDAKEKLNSHGYDERGIGSFEKIRTYLMINMQTLTDKSTSHIAEMMMIGSTMGIINAIRNIADYNHAKKDIIKLMETLKAFEEKSYGDLQKFI
mgnify:CR=1 FL=1